MNRSKMLTKRFRVGGAVALATGALLVAGVATAGADRGADDNSSSPAPAAAVVGNDDGTADQGRGDVGGATSIVPTSIAPTTGVPTTGAPTTAPPTTSAPAAAPAATRTIPVAGVGIVVITEQPLRVVTVSPANGFTSRTESSAREIHVKFFDASGGRIDVQAEIEDGAVRVRIRDRRAGATSTASSGSPATTVPGTDDHGGRRTGTDDRGTDDRGDPARRSRRQQRPRLGRQRFERHVR